MMIYGTAWKKEKTAELVALAIKSGFRRVDTACQPTHYNEPGVGEGIAASVAAGIVSREDVWIQTKYTPTSGQDTSRPLPYDASASLTDQVSKMRVCVD
jgi:diketogulonate reductase-like aldo/keto reductase